MKFSGFDPEMFGFQIFPKMTRTGNYPTVNRSISKCVSVPKNSTFLGARHIIIN